MEKATGPTFSAKPGLRIPAWYTLNALKIDPHLDGNGKLCSRVGSDFAFDRFVKLDLGLR
jgi:hypothetical protein